MNSKIKEAKAIIRDLMKVAPTGCCHEFHHGKNDRHDLGDPCKPQKRYQKLLGRARQFVLNRKN